MTRANRARTRMLESLMFSGIILVPRRADRADLPDRGAWRPAHGAGRVVVPMVGSTPSLPR